MDTMIVTKIVGSLCTAGLVFLFGKWGADSWFSQGAHEAPHGDAHAEEGEHAAPAQAYTIQVAQASSSEAEGGGDGGAGVMAAMAAADPAKGEKVFAKCKACHKIEAGANGVGPSLAGIVGKDIGTVEGFKYSKAMEEIGGVWDEAMLDAYLKDVKGTIPGTKMSFPGIKSDEQRADLIAWLMGDAFDAGKYAGAVPAGGGDDSAAEGASDEGAGEETSSGDAQVSEGAAVAAGDPAKGEKVFAKCKACHKVEAGANGVGPSLAGIVGKDIGTVEGFKYSKAMEEIGGVWDEAMLDAYLKDVKGTIPGTKMSFPGIKSDEQRADIIAYLATLQ